MCLLLETIRLENGIFHNLALHTHRMNRARKSLFGATKEINLERILDAKSFETGVYKCRIIYDGKIQKTEFIPYQLPVIRSLKAVTDNEITYSFKYANRAHLEQLYRQREKYDDILIVKHGLITDTYFANILFYNGKEWITPAHPLLKGIQRQHLLETDQIVMADIRPSDLRHFQKARLVNAMIRFEDELDVPIENLCF